MNVGILGAGSIAAKMAETINEMKDVNCYAIGSRNFEKAKEFASKYSIEKSYGSYEEFLEDDRIDLVYIATPHSHHHRWTIESLNAGKNVLCEKAFAANSKQANEMISVAKEKNRFLAEAIWTRYMPSRFILKELIESGEIGEVKTVDSNLGYNICKKERLINPALAGGCLLDLTVYPLNFSSMILGNNHTRIHATMVPTETGVDGQDNVMIEYESGAMATMFTTMYSLTDRRGLICGDKGFIVVENINNPSGISVYDAKGNLKKEIEVPKQITGYEYEILSCKKALEDGKTECDEMPHSETLEIMNQMDEIRLQFGIHFPFE